MEFKAEGPLAVPLWINGRPYLCMGERLFDVVNPASGAVIRRVPLCGASEVDIAVNAARQALAVWAAQPLSARQRLLLALAENLENYAAHFAKLLGDECGVSPQAGATEVAEAVAALREGALRAAGGGVLAVVVDDHRPLLRLAEVIAPATLAGATIVCKPSPRAPGAAFALCELCQRAGWPAGVLNLVHGDTAVFRGFCLHPDIAEIAYRGEPDLGQKLQAIAAEAGKPFESGEKTSHVAA